MSDQQLLTLLLGNQIDTGKVSVDLGSNLSSDGQTFAQLLADFDSGQANLFSEEFLNKLSQLESDDALDLQDLNAILPLLEEEQEGRPEVSGLLLGLEARQTQPGLANAADSLAQIIQKLKQQQQALQTQQSDEAGLEALDEADRQGLFQNNDYDKHTDLNLLTKSKIAADKLAALGNQIQPKENTHIIKDALAKSDQKLEESHDTATASDSTDKLTQALTNLQLQLKTKSDTGSQSSQKGDLASIKSTNAATNAQVLGTQQAQEDFESILENELNIHETLDDANWGESLGERLLMMTNKNVSSASIRINPPELGPLEVKIKLTENQASIVFNSQHAAVRDAVEHALPRLREMFGQNGIDIANIDVADRNPNQQQSGMGHEHHQQHGGLANHLNDNYDNSRQSEVIEHAMAMQRVQRGLVDFYA